MLNNGLKLSRLSREVKDDFYKVHRAGEYGEFCLCGFWWMENVNNWDKRTEEEACVQREALFARGIEDGYLLYQNEEPVGWCQACQRDQLPHLVNKFHFLPEPETWCISCFMIIPSQRGKGLAHQFLDAVLKDLKQRGVKKVQAYPKSEPGLSANDVWTGPQALFLKAGFVMTSELPQNLILEKEL